MKTKKDLIQALENKDDYAMRIAKRELDWVNSLWRREHKRS